MIRKIVIGVVLVLTINTRSADAATIGKISFVAMDTGGRNDFRNYVINEDGTNPQLLVQRNGGGGGPDWSPDGKSYVDDECIWYVGSIGTTPCFIFLRYVDGRPAQNLSSVTFSAQDIEPSISPDGKQIVFLHYGLEEGTKFYGWYIYTMNIDGKGRKRLTALSSPGEWSPSWTPDGTQILFTKPNDAYTSDTMALMNRDGSNVRRVESIAGYSISSPKWSPTGDKIVFVGCKDPCTIYDNNHTYDIFTMNVDGTSVRKLTDTKDNFQPAWSPDGTKIAFVSKRSGQNQIYVMNADGTSLRTLTTDPESKGSPAWVPTK